MFFEGALGAAGLPDYDAFSVRIHESQLHTLLPVLDAISAPRVSAMRAAGRRVRDYFVYKDMYNPDAADRAALLSSGERGADAFGMIARALERRARRLGKLSGYCGEGAQMSDEEVGAQVSAAST